MKNLFAAYFRPTDDEFRQLWNECIFAFDANTLLNIYRYTPKTSDRFFEVLRRLQDRIWLPYQVAKEYFENRLEVISKQYEAYDEVTKLFDSIEASLENGSQQYKQKHKRHPYIDIQELLKGITPSIKKARSKLNKIRQAHANLLEADNLRDILTELFEGKVGKPYSDKELSNHYKTADERIKQQIPPGYKDDKKDVPKRFGDIIIWFQLLDYAKGQKKPLIFVTDDHKEDWWSNHRGQTVSPRPELIQEMKSVAGQSFYMYSPEQFMKYAEDYLHLTRQSAITEEIHEIQEQSKRAQLLEEVGRQIRTLPTLNQSLQTIPSLQNMINSLPHPDYSKLLPSIEPYDFSAINRGLNEMVSQISTFSEVGELIQTWVERESVSLAATLKALNNMSFSPIGSQWGVGQSLPSITSRSSAEDQLSSDSKEENEGGDIDLS